VILPFRNASMTALQRLQSNDSPFTASATYPPSPHAASVIGHPGARCSPDTIRIPQAVLATFLGPVGMKRWMVR